MHRESREFLGCPSAPAVQGTARGATGSALVPLPRRALDAAGPRWRGTLAQTASSFRTQTTPFLKQVTAEKYAVAHSSPLYKAVT